MHPLSRSLNLLHFRFGWKVEWHMSLGDAKSEIVKDIIHRAQTAKSHSDPFTLVECGSYGGYSTVLFGSLLSPSDRLISIESVPDYSEISSALCARAGLTNVKFISKSANDAIKEFKTANTFTRPIDVLFLDHDKDEYLPTLRAFESCGLIGRGTVIIADNVIYPGCPAFSIYVRTAPEHYQCTLHATHNGYEPDVVDGVEEIIRLK